MLGPITTNRALHDTVIIEDYHTMQQDTTAPLLQRHPDEESQQPLLEPVIQVQHLGAAVTVDDDAFEEVLLPLPVEYMQYRDTFLNPNSTVLTKKRARLLRAIEAKGINVDLQRQNAGLLTNALLSTTIDPEMTAAAISAVKDMADVFSAAKSSIVNDPICTRVQKAERLFNLLKPYELEINVYMKQNPDFITNAKVPQTLKDMVKTYNMLQRKFDNDVDLSPQEEDSFYIELSIPTSRLENLGAQGSMKDILAVKAERANKSREALKHNVAQTEITQYTQARNEELRFREKENEDMDKTLSNEQLNSVEAIDKWIIKRANYGSTNLSFISALFEMSKRERMFVYAYVTQGNIEEEQSPYHIFAAMNTEEVSIKEFDNSLHGNKLKVWNYINHHDILWEKLEVGIQAVKEHRADLIENSKDKIDERGFEDSIADEQTRETYKNLPAESKDAVEAKIADLYANNPQIKALLTNLNDKIDDFRDKIAISTAAIKERDEASRFTKKKKTLMADRRVSEAMDAYYSITQTDQNIQQSILDALKNDHTLPQDAQNVIANILGPVQRQERIDGNAPGKFVDSSTTFANTLWTVGNIVKIGAKSSAYGNVFAGEANDYTMASATATKNSMITGGSFAIAGGLLGFVGLMKTFKTMHSEWGKNGNWERALSIGDATKGFLNASWGIAGGITTLAYTNTVSTLKDKTKLATMKLSDIKALKDSAEAMKSGTGIAGAVVSSAAAVYDIMEAGIQIKHQVHLSSAKSQLQNLNNHSPLQSSDRKYADNILNVGQRRQSAKLINSGINTTASVLVAGLAITSVFLSGGLAAALMPFFSTGTSLLGSISTKIVDYVAGKKQRRATVEEFLNVTDFSQELSTMGLTGNRAAEEMVNTSEFKEKALNEMMASLGFGSIKSFFRHTIKKMSNFVYNRMFFINGDQQLPIDANAAQNNPECQTWTSFCMSLGLRVQYPTATDQTRMPAAAAIASRLMG